MIKKRTRKIGITFSAFDLCHAGHILMLKEARSVCDYLIVGLHVDPSLERPDENNWSSGKKNTPIMSFEERLIILQGIRYVDEIIPYETEEDLIRILKTRKPDIRIIGSDWKGKQFTGHDLSIEVYYNSRNHTFSSSALRKKLIDSLKNS